jgi:transcriptional regulator with XRE-family HTH domain
MTQAKAARAAGVTQPTYQRWEIGQVETPDDKLKKLAKAFGATEAELRGDSIHVSIYDSKANPEHNYYGEVAVHFRGGGEPILLSISDAACDKLHGDMQQINRTYVLVESLANQTVIIRRDAISDLYFSSEAYDDYGPEHLNEDGSYNREGYKNHIEWQIADPHTWEILECFACDGVGLEDFEDADVKRVEKLFHISDEEYAQLVADGHIKAEDLEREKAKNEKQADQLFEAATDVVYQLSNGGVRRKFKTYSGDDQELYNAVYQLIEYESGADDEIIPEMIRFAPEGGHRMIFVNRLAFDYMSLPTHHAQAWLGRSRRRNDR